MSTITISKFDGGQAQDIRTTQTNECEENLNFDIETNPYQLTPIYDNLTTADPSSLEYSDVTVATVAGNTVLVCVGYESSVSQKPTFYINTAGMNGTWSAQAVGTQTLIKGTLETYLELAFCMGSNGASYNLQRYNSAGSVTNIGSITATAGLSIPRPFVHPSDNKLYIAVGNYIGRWDNSSFIHSNGAGIALKIPSNYSITSLTDWGDYLAIATKPTNGVGNSYVYLWDRDTGLVDANQKIDFGEGELNVLENLNNTLIGVMYPKNVGGAYTSVLDNRVFIKGWTGGSVETLKTLTLTNRGNLNLLKTKRNNKLYFAIGYLETAIYCFYKNASGYWVLTKERFIHNGVLTTNQILSLNAIGDFFYISSIDDAGTKRQTVTSSAKTFTTTSKYKTTINPSMPLSERAKIKQLQAVSLTIIGKSGGNIGLKYSVDGSTWNYIIDQATTAGTYEITTSSETSGNNFLQGKEIQFQIESYYGNKIVELSYKYEVVNNLI